MIAPVRSFMAIAATPPSRSAQDAIKRQPMLPLSKAVEIAWKSIRLRLSRSLLVTSGIVLALAFLMSILTSEAFINGMRRWIENPGISVSREQQQSLSESLRQKRTAVQDAAAESQKKKPPRREAWKAEEALGKPLAEIQKELGLPLPIAAEELETALSADPALVPIFASWLDTARRLKAVQDEWTAPQRLQALMEKNGVPSDPAQIAQSKIQTRWLVALALLVAFVGILNAMLMSVTERFREIGTMKCLGALDGFIIKLFLIESLFQGVVGTVIGVMVGLLLSMAAASIGYGAFAWKNVPWAEVGRAAGICLAVGIVLTVAGALYPSWRAARMQPIEAMRVDT
jgi:cell division protein FtsX